MNKPKWFLFNVCLKLLCIILLTLHTPFQDIRKSPKRFPWKSSLPDDQVVFLGRPRSMAIGSEMFEISKSGIIIQFFKIFTLNSSGVKNNASLWNRQMEKAKMIDLRCKVILQRMIESYCWKWAKLHSTYKTQYK